MLTRPIPRRAFLAGGQVNNIVASGLNYLQPTAPENLHRKALAHRKKSRS